MAENEITAQLLRFGLSTLLIANFMGKQTIKGNTG